MCHLHWAVGRSRFPPFSPPKGQGLDPPTLHDLKWRPKRTRIGPTNPSRLGVAPQKDKDWILHDLERPPKMARIGPPNPSRLGVAPQKDKDWTPQPFTTWSCSPKRQGWDPQPFTTWNCASKGQGWDAPQPFTTWRSGPPKGQGLDRPSLHDLEWLPIPASTESPLLLPASAKTASQKAHMRTRQHSLSKTIASSSTRQDSLAESPHEIRQHSLTESPIQTGTDSQKAHMQCCLFLIVPASTASQKAHCLFRHRPG